MDDQSAADQPQPLAGTINGSLRLPLLLKIYAGYDSWVATQTAACKPGCSTCCTQSVTLSTLEAQHLLAHVARQGDVCKQIASESEAAVGPVITTNHFASLCLEGRGDEGETAAGNWNYDPCFFLSAGRCTIYPARPFVCRSFMSTVPCHQHGYAVTPPALVTVNSLVMQLIEHLDQGRYWGSMNALLARLQSGASTLAGLDQKLPGLAVAQPIPGFLIPPEEQAMVESFLAHLADFGVTLDGILQAAARDNHV